MIRQFNPRNKREFDLVLSFIKEQRDEDFYLTKNNRRMYIDSEKKLNLLLKEIEVSYVIETEDDYTGFLVLWKSLGGNTARYYVKMVAQTNSNIIDLLTMLSWNYSNELYVKLKKYNKFIDTYKSQGFHFAGGRGKQVLLKREKGREINKRFFKGEK